MFFLMWPFKRKKEVGSSICQVFLLWSLLSFIVIKKKRTICNFQKWGVLSKWTISKIWGGKGGHLPTLSPSLPLRSVSSRRITQIAPLQLCQVLCASPAFSSPCSPLCPPGAWLPSLYAVINATHTVINAALCFTKTSSFFKSCWLQRTLKRLFSPTGQSSMFDNGRDVETFKCLSFLYLFQKCFFHLYANHRDLYICCFSHTAQPTSPSSAIPWHRRKASGTLAPGRITVHAAALAVH